MKKVTLFVDAGFSGASYEVTTDIPRLPPGIDSEVSSIKIEGLAEGEFVVLWETKDYSQGDDSLWIEGNGQLENLHRLVRPHGNEHWGDRASAISFQAAPSGSTENRTVIYKGRRDYINGNKGVVPLDGYNPSWGT